MLLYDVVARVRAMDCGESVAAKNGENKPQARSKITSFAHIYRVFLRYSPFFLGIFLGNARGNAG
jgi:hypothetical protein